MLMIVTLLLLISNICYPFSELFKYYAFSNLIKDIYTTNKRTTTYFDLSNSLYAVYLFCFTAAYWIFATKFWVLGNKLQKITKKEDPDKYNSQYRAMYTVVILFCLALALLFAVLSFFYQSYKK